MGVWKEIEKEAMELKNCRFITGDSTRVRFLEDKWCGEAPLCEIFLPLYSGCFQRGLGWQSCGTF